MVFHSRLCKPAKSPESSPIDRGTIMVMADQKLLDEIAGLRVSGASDDSIREKLVHKGWSTADVNGALGLSKIETIPSGINLLSNTPTTVGPGGSWFGNFLALALVVAFGLGSYVYLTHEQLVLPDLTFLFPTTTDTIASSTPYNFEGFGVSPSQPSNYQIVGKAPTQSSYRYTAPVAVQTNPSSAPLSSESSPAAAAVSTPTPTPSADTSSAEPSSDSGSDAPEPTLTLTTNPTSIANGDTSTVTWNSSNANICTSPNFDTSGATSGSMTFTLTSSEEYAMTCTGLGGSVTQTASVAVAVPTPGSATPPAPTNPNPTPGNPAPTPTPIPGTPTIAAGCAVPSSGGGNTFYVDPVNGSDSGDGSAAHPWKTLSTVLASDVSTQQYAAPFVEGAATEALSPKGTVMPGDTILLMSGNYGAITIRGVNSSFITLEAAPGQTPVFTSLIVQGAEKWVIRGIKIQSYASGYSALVGMGTGFYGPVNDIVFDQNSISSADDVSSWSVSDWKTNGRWIGLSLDEGGGGTHYSSCISVTNNHISNVRFGVGFGIDNSLFADNTINNFGDDAFDYDADNILIQGNVITNSLNLQDNNHPDGMQGQIGRVDKTDPNAGYTNITINGNTIIRQTVANPLSGGLQGIDGFDENWTNIAVTNNVIITNEYQGISYASMHNGLIANNTLLYDNSQVGSSGSPDPSTTSWITVVPLSHEGTASTNDLVENNIATDLSQGTSAATFVDNIASKQISLIDPTTGSAVFYNKPGTYGQGNVLDPNLNNGFVAFDTTNFNYNVHLTASSPANGIGTPSSAPSTDRDGNARTAPIAAGAYTSSYPEVSINTLGGIENVIVTGSSSLLASAEAGLENMLNSIGIIVSSFYIHS